MGAHHLTRGYWAARHGNGELTKAFLHLLGMVWIS